MSGERLHIPVWIKTWRGGRAYRHHTNYTDSIITKAQADKLNRHYNRRSATVTHEQV